MVEPPKEGLFRAVLLDAAAGEGAQQCPAAAVGKDARELAHDLNNVLQVISGNLQLLAGETFSLGRARSRIGRAQAALEHGARLTTTLLDRCRTEGKVASLEETIDADRLLQIVPLLQDSVGGGIIIDTDIPASLWHTRLDLVRLQNALLNLAINARDAMQGSGIIALTARNAPGGACGAPDKVILSLADQGDGIAPELVDKIFAPFFTTKPTGTGLGLSIVHEFGKASRADIAVESRAGVGTVFHLAFPRWLAG